MAFKLKHDKSVYENKISRMENLAAELQQHLTTLEGLKNQLHLFWDDVDGQRYAKLITDNIMLVRNAIEQINRRRYTYTEIRDDIGQKETLIDGVIEDVGTAVKTALFLGGGKG